MSATQKILELKCPKCQDLIRVGVDRSMLEAAKRLPIAVSYIHGDPMHSTTIWVDNDFVIRAVEAPDSTILGRVGQPKMESRPAASSDGSLPYEDELMDEAIMKLEKALETIGRMSAEIVLVLTRAHDELTRLSESRRTRAKTTKEESDKKAVTDAHKATKKVTRTQEPRIVKRDY